MKIVSTVVINGLLCFVSDTVTYIGFVLYYRLIQRFKKLYLI